MNKKNKLYKSVKKAHTSNSKTGMGDFYGSGIKNKTGKVRSVYSVNYPSSKNTGNAPRNLA